MGDRKRKWGYSGRLSLNEIVEGMNLCDANARRLLEDAEILLKAKRFASAMALAILSIEESEKEPALKDLSTASSDGEIRGAWKSFRSHVDKSRLWALSDFVKRGASVDSLMHGLFDPNAEHPQMLDRLKQAAIYLDLFGKGHGWSKPWDNVSEDLARGFVETARLLASKKDHKLEELELWVQLMAPARKTGSGQAVLRALLAWEQETMRRGWVEDSEAARRLRKAYLNLLQPTSNG